MNAEIITIGDEILIGQIVDTNSAWISEHLNAIGIRVASRISVGDEPHAIADAVTDALNSADIVITTGGLGPTKDDITKNVLADLFKCGMKEDRATFERNKLMLNTRGIDYNGLNRSQAMVPECCEPLPNPNGTAPGMWFDRRNGDGCGRVLISLPGVPFEMKHLMDEEVIPRLRHRFNLGRVTHKTLVTFGLAESILAETLTDWENALPAELHLAYLPSPSGIRLRLSAYDVEDAQRLIDARFAELENIIPSYIVGYGDATVQSAVAEILTRRRETLAVAESCTGGTVSSRFTAIAGASDYFRAGIVSYDNAAKVNILGVNADDIERYGAVSQTVAEQMAAGARRISGADYAIATTGIAGPAGGTDENPVGTVWIAVSHAEGVLSRRYVFGRLRDQNIDRASAAAINLLRLILIDRPQTPTDIGTL